MKIVYVYPKFTTLAGTERVLIDKMNYLANQEDIDVMVVTHEQGQHPFVFPLSCKVTHVDLDVRFFTLYRYNIFVRIFKSWKYNNLLVERFNNLMSETRPDIVITTTYQSYIVSMINSCPVSFKKVLESHIDKRYIHCNDSSNLERWKKSLHSFYDMHVLMSKAKRFDILVTLNQSDSDDWSKYVKTKIISNIAHLNSTGLFSELKSNRVIFAGRYTYQKGIPDLFKIWEIVYERHFDWHLDLFGDGNMEEIPYSENERSQKNIHVHQPDSNIFDRYLESSVFVLTSLYEPFGLVMPEAMSCGLPVVAFDCPSGPANILTDGVDGYLIKNRDIDEFAEKLCQLIESPRLRQDMGKAAILSSQRYSTEKVMPQWIRLFQELIVPPQS